MQGIFLILTAALSSTVAQFGPWRTSALCGLPVKAVALMSLIRQEDGRKALEFRAPPVSAEGARTKWSPLYFFSSNVNHWLLPLFHLSARVSNYHDGQTFFVMDQSWDGHPVLIQENLSGHICSLMLSPFWSVRNSLPPFSPSASFIVLSQISLKTNHPFFDLIITEKNKQR